MEEAKRTRLEEAGFKVGAVQEFLGLTSEESDLVEVRLALSAALKSRRKQRSVSQAALARKLKSSQSRVAKMEAGDSSVSIDLLMRALFATGATRKDLAQVIANEATIAE